MPLKPLHAYFVATGSWFLAFGLQSVLFAYLVTLVLNESAERVGFAQMAYLIPGTLLILLGGSVADHFGGGRIAIIGQLLAALMAAGLALTMWLTELTYPLFILFAISMGCAQAILTPARDGLLPVVAGGMIQRRVMQASLIQFGMQMVGLLLASLTDSIGVLYMLAGQSVILLVGVMAYAKLDIVTPTTSQFEISFVKQLRFMVLEGFRSVVASRPMRMVVLQNVAMGLFFMGSYIVTLPLLIRDIYDGTAVSLSWVNAANSLGLFLAISVLLKLGDVQKQGRALIISQWFGSLVLVIAGFKFGFEVLVLNLFVWGMCGGVAMTMSRTIMQEHAPADQRARMMAFYALSFMGAGPLGALLSGYLVTWFGPLVALRLSAGAMLIVSLVVFLEGNLWRLGNVTTTHSADKDRTQ